jgi:hypothetical protein
MGGLREVHAGFWWGNLLERGHLGDPGVGGSIIKIDLQEVGRADMDLVICFRIGRGLNLRVP